MNIDYENYEDMTLHSLQMLYKYLNAHRYSRKHMKIRVALPSSYSKNNDGSMVVIPMSEEFYEKVIYLVIEDIKARQKKVKKVFSEKHKQNY